jgi:hypothetical protein
MGPITGPFPASSIPAIIILWLPPDLKEESFFHLLKLALFPENKLFRMFQTPPKQKH